MAAEQTDQRSRVFISYSRVDSDFAYRLRADLEARGFDTWIDMSKLADQGGANWVTMIERAIDGCQAMVVILSPDAAQSDNVHMEYHRIQKQKKLLVPIHYRTVSNPRMDIDLTQWIEFREGQGGKDWYQTGLANLIRSLVKAPKPPHLPLVPTPPVTRQATPTILEGADKPEFRPASPAPPELAPEIQEWIAGAFVARGEGNLASEEYFLRRLVESGNAQVKQAYVDRLNVVTAQLRDQAVASLRAQAAEAVAAKQWRRALGAWQALLSALPNDAAAKIGIRQARVERASEALRDGEYDEAVGAWQALLKAEPSAKDAQDGLRRALRARADSAWSRADWIRAAESWETLRALNPSEPNAKTYLDVIKQNQGAAHRYRIAQQLLAAGNVAGASAALEDLYTVASHYGDPAGIAAQIGVSVPKRSIIEPSVLSPTPAPVISSTGSARATGKSSAKPPSSQPSMSTKEPLSFTGWGLLALAALLAVTGAPTEALLLGLLGLSSSGGASSKVSDAMDSVLIWILAAIATLVIGPANYLAVAIASAAGSGNWWTGTMAANSFKLAWMSLLLLLALFILLQIVAAVAGIWAETSYSARSAYAAIAALICTLPGCWIIALWLYTSFHGGIDWVLIGIIAGAGIGGVLISSVACWIVYTFIE